MKMKMQRPRVIPFALVCLFLTETGCAGNEVDSSTINDGAKTSPSADSRGELSSSDGSASECTRDLACDDGNPCTDDIMDSEQCICVHTPLEGERCDDSNACTEQDQCTSEATCSGKSIACEDGNPCTLDKCDSKQGCISTQEPDGTLCDDGNAETADDYCKQGTCVSSAPPQEDTEGSESQFSSLEELEKEGLVRPYRGVKHAARVGDYIELSGSRFVLWGGERSGSMPKGVAVTRDGKWVLTSNLGRKGGKNIAVYRPNPFEFSHFISHSGNAIEILPSVDNKRIFVTNQEKYGHLDILDAETLERTDRIRISGFPKWMTESADGKHLYLALWNGNGVAKVTWPEGTITKWKSKDGARYGTGGRTKHPRGMVITKDGKTLIVANNSDRSISFIDLETFRERKRMNVGVAPRHLVLSPDGKTAYLAETGRGIAFLDVESEKIFKRVRVGKSPKSIVLSKDGKFVYVSDFRGHSLSVIDTETYETKRMKLNILRSSGIDVHPDDQFIYISGWCTNDLWAVQRVDAGGKVVTPLGKNRSNDPCYACEMSSTGCPSRAELNKHKGKP